MLHSTIAHGMVKSIDTSEAEKIPGVVKVLTCFDVPNRPFPTAGHPWSVDPSSGRCRPAAAKPACAVLWRRRRRGHRRG
ncbi:MAG: hypothetical protein R2912_12570 [Eubacteriales bacterium]